jgi:hypothetical protein
MKDVLAIKSKSLFSAEDFKEQKPPSTYFCEISFSVMVALGNSLLKRFIDCRKGSTDRINS